MADFTNTDPLDDFERRTIMLLDRERLVYVAGKGPAVVVMTEMPGISPHVARFARWVRDAGFTVYMPHLFGKDGAPPSALYAVSEIAKACISKEFRAFAANASSPITQWLRALAGRAHSECGGKGVARSGCALPGTSRFR